MGKEPENCITVRVTFYLSSSKMPDEMLGALTDVINEGCSKLEDILPTGRFIYYKIGDTFSEINYDPTS